jgi:predicted PurR-regulated permease PerM
MSTANGRRSVALERALAIVPPTLAVLAILGLVLLAWNLRGLLILAFVGALIAAALHGPSEWLERRGVPRGLAVAGVYLAIALVVTGLVVVIVPPLIDQAAALVQDLPSIVDRAYTITVGTLNQFLGGGVADDLGDQIAEEIGNLSPDIATVARLPLTLFEALLGIGTTLFLSLLLLLERDRAASWGLRFVDEKNREAVAGVIRAALEKLGAYVRGQIVVMTAIGIATTIGMIVLGVPFALPLGLLAFLTELIPLVGPFIAAVPILVVAFLVDVPTGLLMAAWLVVVQQAEGWLLTPLVQGKVLSLSPVVVLLAVFGGGQLAGIVGAVIAVPILAVVDVILRDVVLPLREGRPVGPDPPGDESVDEDAS